MNTSRWATQSPPAPIASAAQPASPKPDEPALASTTTHVTEVAPPQPIYNESTYVPQNESIDEFAQTRPPDDLFDDDFIPLDEPAPAETVQPYAEDVYVVEPLPAPPVQPASRGRGGAPRARRGITASRYAPTVVTPRAVEPSAPTEPTTEVADGADTTAQVAKPEQRREAAVRGDRSRTGGPKRSKLTEDELSAKLDAMKIKNATLTAKHEKSQADEELFHQREADAALKRKEDRVNRQQMMGERERNRLRKLKAQGGREWDIEKDEKAFEGSERRGNRRGAFGGVVNDRPPASAPTEHANDSQHAGPRERGRGRGRGGRGGDSGGRGNANTNSRGGSKAAQAVPSANDFPELPGAQTKEKNVTTVEAAKSSEDSSAKDNESKADTKASLASLVPAGEKKSWADEVEAGA